jgi:hypothetical protein
MAPHRTSSLEATLNETLDLPGESSAQDAHRDVAVLVLLWCRDEAERVGEAVHLPPGSPELYTIGRATGIDDDGAIPLHFGQLRPSGRLDTGPLHSLHISRRQLGIAHHPGGGLRIEQIGRNMLRLDGHPMSSGVIQPGGLIEVMNRFVLFYTHRPARWLQPRAAELDDGFAFGAADRWGIVGESPAAWELRRRAAFLAEADEHVLVLGPSGTGKELIVQAIHGQSRRAGAPLVARNAATIPETLIDAELFGNLRNYPNPGMPERAGLLGEADGGALFLDEIGELPPRMQAHLLRVMDHGEYQRLGEARVRRADLRILAATNREPAELKHDFLARFPHRIQVPGLDARAEDIILVARHLLHTIVASTPHLASTLRAGPPTLGPELAATLVGYRFTTHVRELHELLWAALQADLRDTLGPPPDLMRLSRPRPPDPEPTPAPGALSREAVQAVLDRCDGVKEVAWRELGLRNRFQLHRVLKKLGFE